MVALLTLRDRLSGLLVVALLAGCGRGTPTSPAASEPPEPVAAVIGPHVADPLRENKPPHATILDPVPGSALTPVLENPVSIRWTGTDPEDNLREYRYRVFGKLNPDFPEVEDFPSFLIENSDAVLRFYDDSDFQGWERVLARAGAPQSATLPTLSSKQAYAFVVVAFDQRKAHDRALSSESNVLRFVVTPPLPGLSLFGSFGEVFLPAGTLFANIEALANQPLTLHWEAVAPEGETVVGYRWGPYGLPLQGEPTLENTQATVDPVVPDVLLWVEVTMESGLHALYVVHITFV